MTEKGKNLLIWKWHVTMTKEDAFISNEMQLQNHSSAFIHKSKSLLSATSILYRCLQSYCFLGRAKLYRLCGLGKCQDRFGQFSWSKKDPNYLDVKLKVFKKDDKKEFRLVHSESQISTSLFDWGIRWSLQQKTLLERKIYPSADTYNVQRHGWTTRTGSQGSWHSGPSK